MKAIRPVAVTPSNLTSTNVPETEYSEWLVGTTYSAGQRVQQTTGSFHGIYESAVGSNLGHSPELDLTEAFWLLVGATNPYRMFDSRVSSQTSNPDSIEVVVDLDGDVADSVALMNVQAATAQVVMTDPVEGEVYNESKQLLSTGNVIDWWTYFFEPFERRTDVVFDGMGAYPNASIEVILTEAGATVYCGQCVPGQSRDFGGTRWSPRVGIQDYSVKGVTDFGDSYVVERAFAKRAAFDVWVATASISSIQSFMATYRAQVLVWIGDEDHDALIIMGFYKEFELELAYPDKSLFSLDIEGLT